MAYRQARLRGDYMANFSSVAEVEFEILRLHAESRTGTKFEIAGKSEQKSKCRRGCDLWKLNGRIASLASSVR